MTSSHTRGNAVAVAGGNAGGCGGFNGNMRYPAVIT